MPAWVAIAIQVLATGVTVALVLATFWGLVVRPYLDRKVGELIQASEEIEPKVTRGVKRGVEETIKGLPESAIDGTVKESTRQFLKFGSGLFENGLSSFLGSAADLERKAEAERREQRSAD